MSELPFALQSDDPEHADDAHRSGREEERTQIVAYLRHIASVQVGTILTEQSRAIVEFCASWVESRLDEKWAREMAEREDTKEMRI